MGSNKGKFDDEERTMITSEEVLARVENRERVFQRSLSEDDIEKFLPPTGEVPATRLSARPSVRPVERDRASQPAARRSERALDRHSAPAARNSAPPARNSAPAARFEPSEDEESTQIFQGAHAMRAAQQMQAKKNTLLSPGPNFDIGDHSVESGVLGMDDGNDPTIAADVSRPTPPISMFTPEARRSAPPPAFARRAEPEMPIPSTPASSVNQPPSFQAAPSYANSGSLAVAVSATPSAAEPTRDSRSTHVRPESKRSMLPWTLAFAAVALLAAGGSFATLRHRSSAHATAAFIDPAVQGAQPAPVDHALPQPAAAPEPQQLPVQLPVQTAAPVEPQPLAANPTPEPAKEPAAQTPESVKPDVAAKEAKPAAAARPRNAGAQPAAVARPQPVERPVAVAVEKPAPVPVEKPAKPEAKKKGAAGMTDEEKRAGDEAKRLAEKQLEQSL